MSVLLVRTIGGVETLDKTQTNQIHFGHTFPTALRKNQSISISYKGDVWASRYANLTEAVWVFKYFYPQLLQQVMTIRHRKIMTGQQQGLPLLIQEAHQTSYGFGVCVLSLVTVSRFKPFSEL